MANNRFSRGFGSAPGGAFKCEACGKLTRETGHDEAGLGFCKKCLFGMYLENAISDYGEGSPEAKAAAKRLAKLK